MRAVAHDGGGLSGAHDRASKRRSSQCPLHGQFPGIAHAPLLL